MRQTTINASNFKQIFYEILNILDLDPSVIESQISQILQAGITYIPIRHHSPGSALLVKKAIKKFQPKLILIEGPITSNNLIQYIIDDGTIPPIALLSTFSDANNMFKLNGILTPDKTIPAKFQVHYPFLSYSPEYIALQESARLNISSYFIDLPLTAMVPYMIKEMEFGPHYLKLEEDNFKTSKFYEKLIDVFHFNNFDEIWDSLFEIGVDEGDVEQIRECLLIFSACIRETMPSELIENDGILEREQFMKYRINTLISDHNVKKSEVMVITGGIHSIALHTTKANKNEYCEDGLFDSLVPFSFYRLSQQSGYGSGNQAPYFYDKIWKKFAKGENKSFEKTVLEMILEILDDARKQGHLISVTDTINCFSNSKMLAMMRRRMEPCLLDLKDSMSMCLIKGDSSKEGAYLGELIHKKTIGSKIGKVTQTIGKLPLQLDFYQRMESFGIELKEEKQEFTLNLRDEHDLEKSQFFWNLFYLDLGFIQRILGPDILEGETGIFSEIWILQWTPQIDTKLIEFNIYGSTVKDASKNKIIEDSKKNKRSFQELSKLLFHSITMGLSNLFPNISDVCFDSIELDTKFTSLSKGFINSVMIHRYLNMMENQKENPEIVQGLIKRSYFASCFLIPQMSNPPRDLEIEFTLAMRDMGTILLGISEIELDNDIFYESLKTCFSNTQNHFIKGCCYGILYLMNYLDVDTLQDNILDYLDSENQIKVHVGEFIRGLIFECKTQLLFNDDIIQVLSQVIVELEWSVFNAVLPSLRKTFSELDDREYEVFTEKIAIILKLKTKEVQELQDDLDERVLMFFSEIDKIVKEIFNTWFGGIK